MTSESGAPRKDLATVINDYRKLKKKLAIPTTTPLAKALEKVALAHAQDLSSYAAELGAECKGKIALHSWSKHSNPPWKGIYGAGAWQHCCYSWAEGDWWCMTNKPREIADCPLYGYEIVYGGSPLTAQAALDWWTKPNDTHADVILNTGMWESHHWEALGAAISGGYACAWFGSRTRLPLEGWPDPATQGSV